MRHVAGKKAIFLAKGPKSYIDGDAHQIFVDCRFHLVRNICIQIGYGCEDADEASVDRS